MSKVPIGMRFLKRRLIPDRSLKRIPRLLKRLQTSWEKAPSLRLGQLMVNAVQGDNLTLSTDLFYMEDDELIETIEAYLSTNKLKNFIAGAYKKDDDD